MTVPSAITSLARAMCRVCGTRLGPPLVACPRCESPHHADCWEYNGGCSTYGCREQVPATVPDEAPPVETLSGAHLFFEAFDPRGNPTLAVVLAIALTRLAPAPWDGVLLLGTLIGYGAMQLRRAVHRQALSVEAEPGSVRALAERGEDEDTALETKAISTLLGAGFPHALAQSYALFEQRHPRHALPLAEQAALAAELAAAGYRVLALEALDKVASPVEPRESPLEPPLEPPLEVRRDQLLSGELAYAVVPAAEDTGGAALFARARFRLAALRRAGLHAAPAVYLASLSPGGWPWEIRGALFATGPREASLPDRGWLIAGPFAAPRARELADHLWDRGHPAISLTAEDLALDDHVLAVTGTHLSQEEARFRAGAQELVIPWPRVTDVLYGLVVQEERILDRPPAGGGGPRSDLLDLLPNPAHPERTTYRAVLELHVGEERQRLRIDQPGPEIFRYLGRRIRYIESENLKLVAKDLVRFAPAARFSHGILGLMLKRAIPGCRFEGQPLFEEYVRWFVALGRPAVRQRLEVGTASS